MEPMASAIDHFPTAPNSLPLQAEFLCQPCGVGSSSTGRLSSPEQLPGKRPHWPSAISWLELMEVPIAIRVAWRPPGPGPSWWRIRIPRDESEPSSMPEIRQGSRCPSASGNAIVDCPVQKRRTVFLEGPPTPQSAMALVDEAQAERLYAPWVRFWKRRWLRPPKHPCRIAQPAARRPSSAASATDQLGAIFAPRHSRRRHPLSDTGPAAISGPPSRPCRSLVSPDAQRHDVHLPGGLPVGLEAQDLVLSLIEDTQPKCLYLEGYLLGQRKRPSAPSLPRPRWMRRSGGPGGP